MYRASAIRALCKITDVSYSLINNKLLLLVIVKLLSEVRPSYSGMRNYSIINHFSAILCSLHDDRIQSANTLILIFSV